MRRAIVLLGLALALPALADEPPEDEPAPAPAPGPDGQYTPPPPPPPQSPQPPQPPQPIEVTPLAPMAPAPPPPIVVEPPESQVSSSSGFHPLLALGVGTRTLYTVPFVGAQLSVDLAWESPRAMWLLTIDILVGASSEGLLTVQPQLGMLGLAKLTPRLRLGGGWRNGVFSIKRATNGTFMSVVTTGPRIALAYDLAQLERSRAVYLAVDLGIDGTFFASTLAFDGEIAVGFKF